MQNFSGPLDGTPDPKCARCRHAKGWHNRSCDMLVGPVKFDILPKFCGCPEYAKDNLALIEQEAFFKKLI